MNDFSGDRQIQTALFLNSRNTEAINSLKKQWLAAAFVAAVTLLGVAFAVQRLAIAPNMTGWLLMSGAVAGGVVVLLRMLLRSNHAPGSTELYSSLGVATWLTLVGGLLTAMMAGFLFIPQFSGWLAWAPAVLYLSSRVIDLFDGALARLTNHVSVSGAALDIELDGLGLLFAVLLSMQYGRLPNWYLLLALLRLLFVFGIWLRKRMGKRVAEMPPSLMRRVIAGCQSGFIAVVLWPIVDPSMSHLTAIFFTFPLIASFGRDWLVVSCVWHVHSRFYAQLRAMLVRTVVEWLPFVSRLFVMVAMLGLLWNASTYDGAPLAEKLYAPVIAAAMALFVLGVAARTMSVGLLLVLLVYPPAVEAEWLDIVLLAAATVVLHLGSGAFSLWRPEDRLLYG